MPAFVYPNASQAQKLSMFSVRMWARPTKLPIATPAVSQERKLYKPGPVRDVVVEREQLEASAIGLYQAVLAGEVKQLLAGTGCGKTTKLPLLIASKQNVVGVVVMPDRVLTREVYKYCRDLLVPAEYTNVSVVHAVQADDILNLESPGVAYISAADLLAVMVNDSVVLNSSQVTFMYVDESHEKIPEYYVLRLMSAAGFFPGIKVFMGSATASGDNLEARGASTRRTLSKVKPAEVNYASPTTLTAKSPLHYASLQDRTLIFVPSAADMEVLAEYYEDNAVEVFIHSELSQTDSFRQLKVSLARGKRPLAVLVTQAVQTGYTLDVDTVVDCGVSVVLSVNPECTRAEVRQRKVTMSERIQRCGRVGRHMAGTAYYVDADTAPHDVDVFQGMHIYVSLWCKMLQLSVNVPFIREHTKVLDTVTLEQTAALLHSNLHPVLFLPYLGTYGVVPRQLYPVRALLYPYSDTLSPYFSEKVTVDTKSWDKRRLPKVDWFDSPADYIVPFDPPQEWVPLVCLMSMLLSGQQTAVQHVDVSDTVSVVTTFQPKSMVGKDKLRNRYSTETSKRSRRTTRLDSVDLSALNEELESVRSESQTRQYVDCDRELPQLPEKSKSYRRRRSYRGDSYNNAQGSVGSRKSSSAGSDGARDSAYLSRVKISPSKLTNQRIYPFDDELFATASSKQGLAEARDSTLYHALRKFRVEIATMSEPDCDEYFLAVVSQWNRAVVGSLQLRAKPLGIVQSVFTSPGEMYPHDSIKESCKRLLIAFGVRGRFISIEKSSRQCGSGHVSTESDNSAKYVLTIGNDYLRTTVEYLKYKLVVHFVMHERRGVYLAMKDFSVGVYHTFAQDQESQAVALNTPRADVQAIRADEMHDYIVFVHTIGGVLDREVRFREPVNREDVIIVTVSDYTDSQVVYGPCAVFGVSEEWYCTVVLPDGTSGSVLVAVGDGAIVGFHIGRRSDSIDFNCSAFVSADLLSRVLY